MVLPKVGKDISHEAHGQVGNLVELLIDQGHVSFIVFADGREIIYAHGNRLCGFLRNHLFLHLILLI